MANFEDVFKAELDVINFRRRSIREGDVAWRRANPTATQQQKDMSQTAPVDPVWTRRHHVVKRSDATLASAAKDDWDPLRVAPDARLTGLALSGGGVRSASFCLGVLQGLDAISNSDEPHVLDAVDYISTVSGGGYIGISLVQGMMQEDYTFPFDSKEDEQETKETQHIRDFSNFLAPYGMTDYLTSAALVMRGLLVNAMTVLPWLLLAAVITVQFNPTAEELAKSNFGSRIWKLPSLEPLPVTGFAAGLMILFLVASTITTSLAPQFVGTLWMREELGRKLGGLLVVIAAIAFAEMQPLVLAGMFVDHPAGISNLPEALKWIGQVAPTVGAVLLPFAAALIALGQKLEQVVKSVVGEGSWTATLKKYSGQAMLYLAGAIVPLLLWVAYLYLAFWAISRHPSHPVCNPKAPGWLQSLPGCTDPISWITFGPFSLGPITLVYLAVFFVLFIASLALTPNANSLHGLYRDRLSRAFLMKRRSPAKGMADPDVDSWKISSQKGKNQNGWLPGAAFAPYLISNTTVNLQASEELSKRGRGADSFMISPLYVGSRSTGYVETLAVEKAVPELTLGTIMATSGAAASANAGKITKRMLTFGLSLLNIRLGFWLANPSRFPLSTLSRFLPGRGAWYFFLEAFGRLKETRSKVYLTDGGHIDNLGIYELLRRRCKVIVAVDAEADPDYTFPSFVELQVLARIDLGVRIDLPWRKLRETASAVTSSDTSGGHPPSGTAGPHAAIGKIRYSEKETGVLIYIKASMSGDENDYIRDYKRTHGEFPHETTIDQFFNETQFEVYRSLGFHNARRLFLGLDSFATLPEPPNDWVDQVYRALLLLNLRPKMAKEVASRMFA